MSVHEPVPRCGDRAMQAFLHGRPRPLRRIMPEKLASIEALKRDKPVYAESSNTFIKGFGWLLPEHVPAERIGVVVLKRDVERIVQSFRRIGTSCLTNTGRKWHILPSRKDPLVEPPSLFFGPKFSYRLMRVLAAPFRNTKVRRLLGLRSFSWTPRFIQRYEEAAIRWYVEETWAMGEAYRRQFPDIRFYEVDINELNDVDKVSEMFRFFGLEPSPRLGEVVGVVTNLKSHAAAKS